MEKRPKRTGLRPQWNKEGARGGRSAAAGGGGDAIQTKTGGEHRRSVECGSNRGICAQGGRGRGGESPRRKGAHSCETKIVEGDLEKLEDWFNVSVIALTAGTTSDAVRWCESGRRGAHPHFRLPAGDSGEANRGPPGHDRSVRILQLDHRSPQENALSAGFPCCTHILFLALRFVASPRKLKVPYTGIATEFRI